MLTAVWNSILQALLGTHDSSEAYMLLQTLGPMTFDANRLVDTACIGFGHVKDVALRVLRDKFAAQLAEGASVRFRWNLKISSGAFLVLGVSALTNAPMKKHFFSQKNCSVWLSFCRVAAHVTMMSWRASMHWRLAPHSAALSPSQKRWRELEVCPCCTESTPHTPQPLPAELPRHGVLSQQEM